MTLVVRIEETRYIETDKKNNKIEVFIRDSSTKPFALVKTVTFSAPFKGKERSLAINQVRQFIHMLGQSVSLSSGRNVWVINKQDLVMVESGVYSLTTKGGHLGSVVKWDEMS